MAKPVAFITGIAGFAGSWLAEELLREGYRVIGSLYDDEPTDNIRAIERQLTLLPLDLTQADKVDALFKKTRPNYLFHLAAFSSVGKSFGAERLTYRINFEGTLNVLQALQNRSSLKKMVFTSSSDTYGVFSPANKTLTESQPFDPASPYGISKAAAEQLCTYHHRRFGVPVVVSRSFNHSGPRQLESFVIPAFAKQAAAIDLGLQKPVIRVGDLSARRDFSDVRDIVRGYRLMAEQGTPGRVYQLCSGKTVSIEKALTTLLGFASKEIKVTVDRSRLRKNDIPVMRGSNRRAVQELGYAVRYTLKQTLQDTFIYWKTILSSGA